MRYDAMYKFDVGDWVTTVLPYHAAPVEGAGADGKKFELKNFRIPLMVIERSVQQCPGGVQTSYKVRPHFMEIRTPQFSGSIRTEPYWQMWTGELKSFNEIELEEFVDEMAKTDNGDDGESITTEEGGNS